MINPIFTNEGQFHWLDVTQPSPGELNELAHKYGLHSTSVQDCLDPEHLPKYERIGHLNFIILRAYDEASLCDADTIQELTRKTAIFFTDKFIITIHRTDQPFLVQLREKWKSSKLEKGVNPIPLIFSDLLQALISSYERPIDQALDELEQLEMSVFEAQGAKPFSVKRCYILKREAFVFKRILRVTMDLLPKLGNGLEINPQDFQNLKEQADSLYFYADELMESVNSLLNLHISLSSQKTNEASHRTNEVMRVLTIFSVFLLPLNVVTGIYGMNFEHMPELKSKWGYPLALSIMVALLFTIYFWFRKRGWLKSVSP